MMPIYMQLGEAKGNVTESAHNLWIEILDMNWSVERTIRSATGVGGNREASAAAVKEMEFVKYIDNASGYLANQYLVSKSEAIHCQIDFTRTGNPAPVFRSIFLDECLVSYLYNTGSSTGSRPTETFRLNFTAIEVTDISEAIQGNPSAKSVISYNLPKAEVS